MEPSSVSNANSLVFTSIKRYQAVNLEVEGGLVAAGPPKCYAAARVPADSQNAKANREKQKTPLEVLMQAADNEYVEASASNTEEFGNQNIGRQDKSVSSGFGCIHIA